MPAQRILIIKHGALGDVVLAMGTMKRLRELHPEAHITLMTMGMFVPMAEQLGVFDDFIVDNRLPYWKLGATWRAVRSIVKGNLTWCTIFRNLPAPGNAIIPPCASC